MEGNLEGNYDFDAPMFVDFTNNEQYEDSDVDKWFDNRDGDYGGIEMDSLEEDEHVLSEERQESTTETENGEVKTVPSPEKGIISDDATKPREDMTERNDEDELLSFFKSRTAPNLVTSFKPRVNTTVTVDEEDQPPLKKQRHATETSRTSNTSDSKVSEPQTKRHKAVDDSISERAAPITRAQQKALNAPRRSFRISRKRTTSTSSTASSSNETTRSMLAPKAAKKQMPKTKAPILTIPSTPTLLKRQKTKLIMAQKPREELELETIAKMRKELKEKRKHNEEFMKKALAAGAYMPYRSAEDNLTQAVEFHFETDKRIKPPPQNSSNHDKEKNFFESLRNHPISPSFKNRAPTKPQPFNFHSNQGKKRKNTDEEDNSCEGYVSMAQQCYSFQTATPPRFHTKTAKEQNSGPPPPSETNKNASKLTCPKTPNLSSKARKRPLPEDCLSREQQEEKEAEEMRNYKFKAREFDPKIVEKKGTYGLKPLPPKTLTEVKPFSLASEQRSEIYKQKEKESHVEEKPVVFKAQPVPEFSKLEFKPELIHQTTKKKPFSFEDRDKQIQAKKELKIQSILEEEKKAREFHAKPLQSFSPMQVTTDSKSATKFEPFNLETENRGAMKAEQWIKKVQEDLQEERKKVVFKAHSSNVLYQAPFVPKKSLKPNTIFNEFDLCSERRAEERAAYEMNKKEREMEDLALQQQRELEREEEERKNIAILRKQLVHKSNPIRSYKQLEIMPSKKTLTHPESPSWHTRERKKLRI